MFERTSTFHLLPSASEPSPINLNDQGIKFSRDRQPGLTVVGKVEDSTLFIKNNGMGFDREDADQKIGVFLSLHSQQKLERTGSS